jgi:hypothetical protein
VGGVIVLAAGASAAFLTNALADEGGLYVVGHYQYPLGPLEQLIQFLVGFHLSDDRNGVVDAQTTGFP